MMGSGVVAEMTPSGATGCTQPVRRKQRPTHGLGTTRGTHFGPKDSRPRATTPESIMSLSLKYNGPQAEAPEMRLPKIRLWMLMAAIVVLALITYEVVKVRRERQFIATRKSANLTKMNAKQA